MIQAATFGEIEAAVEVTTLTHPEWPALLLDREVSHWRDKRLLARLRADPRLAELLADVPPPPR